jgi:hypothetical protein
VEAALFELSPEDVHRSGLPFDRCRAAIVGGSHDPSLVSLLVDSTSEDGWLVTDSAGFITQNRPGCRWLLVGEQIDDYLDRHLRSGGSGCVVQDGVVYLTVAGQRHPILNNSASASTKSTRSRLLAIAAAWALGVSIEKLQTAAAALDA